MSIKFKNPIVLHDNRILDQELDKVESIAKGASTGYVFDTEEDMLAWLEVADNVAKLNLGDNLYIKTTDAPDYWWDGSSIQELGTQKVELEGYVKNTDYANASTGGTIKTYSAFGTVISSGALGAYTRTAAQYATDDSKLFVGKGTLDNLKDIVYASPELVEQKLAENFETLKWNLCEGVEVINSKMHNPASQTVGQPLLAPAAYASGYLVKVEVEPDKPIHFVCEQMANQYSATGYNGKNASRFIVYADEEDNFISGISYPQPGLTNLIVPSNAKYAYITFTKLSDGSYGDYWCTQRDEPNKVDLIDLSSKVESKKNLDALTTKVDVISNKTFGALVQEVRKPIFIFQFDDGTDGDINTKALFDSYGFKCCFALLGNSALYSKQDRYLQYQDEGFEILSHSIDGVAMQTMDYATAEEKLSQSYNILTNAGFKISGFVTPSTWISEEGFEALKKYYQHGWGHLTGTPTGQVIHTYNNGRDIRQLDRWALQSNTVEATLAKIDECVAQNGILCFYGHSYPQTADNMTVENMKIILDHLKELVDSHQAEVKTASEAINSYYATRYSEEIEAVNIIDEIKSLIPTKDIITSGIAKGTIGQYWNIESETVTLASYATYQYVEPIEVEPGNKVTVKLMPGTSAKSLPVIIVDENYKMVYGSSRPTNNVTTTYEFTVPPTGKYMLLTMAGSSSTQLSAQYSICKGTVLLPMAEKVNPFAGKKLSLLGDSISSFQGTIPAGNKVYYTGTNSGVSFSDQMWWSIVCKKLDMEPCVINGWSGSAVTSGLRDATQYTPGSDESRTGNLHTETSQPDVILVALGVNDYSDGATIGDWDGTTNINDDTSTFKNGYATLINRVRTNYPNALVVGITPWFNQRGTDTGIVYKNAKGLTMGSYVKAIKEVCEILGVPVIDGYNIGFNRHNYYPTYCQDSETNPTHPNANGQRVMGNTIAHELLQICNGYLQEI